MRAPIRFQYALLVSLCVLTGAAKPAAAAPRPAPALVVLPARVELAGAGARQQLVVEERQGGFFTRDLTRRARLKSANPRVARVTPDGLVVAVGDGETTVTAVVAGRRTATRVRVRGSRKPASWRFALHVEPVLTRFGCNSGACHGAAAGKGGLKLSLRGYDPDQDYLVLTRQALGRRIAPQEPEASLLLRKPAARLPHGGGQRFKPGSREYGVLAQWIRAGTPRASQADPRLVKLEVYPEAARLRPGDEQQIVVRAVFTDGHVEDVTSWVKFGSSDAAVATVDETGRVKVQGSGEVAITVWYLSRVGYARVAAPFPNRVADATFDQAARHGFIDELVVAKLKALRIPPAGPASDEQFIRRAYLDTIGILPTPEEVDTYVRECATEIAGGRALSKTRGRGRDRESGGSNPPIPLLAGSPTLPPSRAVSAAYGRLIDRLLARPEFVDYWAYKWSDLLLVSSRKLPSRGMWAFYQWIRDSVARNKPWDQFVREIVTASGSTVDNGAANFFVLHKDPIDLTETTSQAFLGMSLTCARCHNHPMEKWTQNDYYGMANFFGRVRLKAGDVAGENLVVSADAGDVNHPRLGTPMPPKPLDGSPLPLDGSEDRRAALAKWLTAPENPYFARAIVNRVWRNFMGRGLVEAEDDLRLTNPPSNPELMEALTADFVRHGFDVRHLIRTIMTSAAYQRSSVPAPGAGADQVYYSTYVPRRLSAEVLLDTISQVTGTPTEFAGYPAGTRAMQLPDAQVSSYFLTAFGRAPREQTCSCERQEEPNVAQALHLSNGATVNDKLRAKGSVAESLAAGSISDEQLLDQLYLRALSRRPTPEEKTRVLEVMRKYPAASGSRRELVEDLLAAIITSKEFLFNH